MPILNDIVSAIYSNLEEYTAHLRANNLSAEILKCWTVDTLCKRHQKSAINSDFLKL